MALGFIDPRLHRDPMDLLGTVATPPNAPTGGPSTYGIPTDISTGSSDSNIGSGIPGGAGGGSGTTIADSGILSTLGTLLGKLGGGSSLAGLGNAGLLGLLGMGEAGNLSLQSQEGQVLTTLVNLLQKYASMTPGQAAQGIQAFQQPMSQALNNQIMNQVQAAVGERGFAGSPGIMGEATAEALAPYGIQEQQLASQNYWNLEQLPIEAAGAIKFPPLQNLSGLTSYLASGGINGGLAKLITNAISKATSGAIPTADAATVGSVGGSSTVPLGTAGSTAGTLADPAATLGDYATLPLGAAAGSVAAGAGAAGAVGGDLATLPLGTMAGDASILGSLGGATPGWIDPATSVASEAAGASGAGEAGGLLSGLGTAATILGPVAAAFGGFTMLMSLIAPNFADWSAQQRAWFDANPVMAGASLANQRIAELTQQLNSGVIPPGERQMVQQTIGQLQQVANKFNSGNV